MKYIFGLGFGLMLTWGTFLPASAVAASDAYFTEAVMIALYSNTYRTEGKQAPLRLSAPLFLVAATKAEQMARSGEFAHILSDGVTLDQLLLEQGYNFAAAGENIAFGYADAGSAVAGFASSPVHLANIKSANFTEVGVAVVPMWYDGRWGKVVVQVFGREL